MALPKRRWSHARKGMHRAHHALKAKGTSVCPRCSANKRPHEICGNCGYYKGSQLLQPKPGT
jgi:large subunit ribosomal protein L32